MQEIALHCLPIPADGYHRDQGNPPRHRQDRYTYYNPHVGAYGNAKTLQNYTAFVNKSFSKPENIIKLMQLPDKEFAERYEMFMEGGTVQDFEKILQVRGGKKGDFSALFKSIEAKNL